MPDPKLPHADTDRPTDDLPPEAINSEQDDESSQAQTVADEALGRATSGLGDIESEKVPSGDDTDGVQDLVDHMKQMESSGHIDMSAFAGERNDDEEEGRYGNAAEEE